MGLQPHYIAKKEMIEINGQTTFCSFGAKMEDKPCQESEG